VNKLFLGLALFVISVLGQANAQDVYKLGPGDKIEIKVYGQDELTVEVLLSNSGVINYPFLGEIKVTGLSVTQVEMLITKGLKGDYLISPNVSTQVTEYRQFYIHGEVKKPGGYPYQPGMTINQAVALAGGLTERASKEKVFLFREIDKNQQLSATLSTKVSAGDTITIEQRFF
jgi:polysaccharide export outer membrane protein